MWLYFHELIALDEISVWVQLWRGILGVRISVISLPLYFIGTLVLDCLYILEQTYFVERLGLVI